MIYIWWLEKRKNEFLEFGMHNKWKGKKKSMRLAIYNFPIEIEARAFSGLAFIITCYSYTGTAEVPLHTGNFVTQPRKVRYRPENNVFLRFFSREKKTSAISWNMKFVNRPSRLLSKLLTTRHSQAHLRLFCPTSLNIHRFFSVRKWSFHRLPLLCISTSSR